MNVWHDVRFAARLLAKDRWFTAAAATALALGIGVNATVFTLVNAVLLRGLPFENPDRLMALSTENARGGRMGVSHEDFVDWHQARAFSHLVASLGSTVNVSDEERVPERYQGSYVSWNLFRMLGEQPILGRDFREDDDRTGAEPVMILGYDIWQNRYGGDPNILGRAIKANSRSATVVGIMPRGLEFPSNVDLWLPLAVLPPDSFPGRGGRNLTVIGRLAPGATLEQARAELSTIGQRLSQEYPATNKDLKPRVARFDEDVNGGPIRLVFLSMQGAVAFVLLIACANVANLLLARSAARGREIAVRLSLGASRWRIVRQLLVESLLLAAIGTAGGLVVAIFGVRWFDQATVEVGKPYWMVFTFDPIVFVFVGAICIATALLFGLAPALHVSKTNVNDVLKEGGRTGSGSVRTRRWAGALVVSELVLTVVLLAGAGFMFRSFFNLYRLEAGIDTSNLVTMQIYLPLTKYPLPGPRAELYDRLDDRLQTMGGDLIAIATTPPLSGGFGRGLALDGRMPPEGEQAPIVTMVAVTDKYFETVRIPIRRGRAFTRDDGRAGRSVAVVNERFVAVHSAGRDPIGRQLRFVGGPATSEWATIVGVVPTVRQRGVREQEPDPVVYVPLRAEPERTVAVLARTGSNATTAAERIREQLRVVEPDVPLFNVRTMEQLLARQRWEYVTFGSMFGVFAGIALLLSAVGLYAVTAYSVVQRTQEIGVRMALGAQPRSVLWLFGRRALGQLAVGLTLGMPAAVGVGFLLRSLLVGATSTDPATLIGIALLLITVSVAACMWPARRATRLDPMIALRYE